MSSTAIELKQAAIQIANDIKGRSLALEKERVEIETRLLEIKAISDSVGLVHERAANFIPIFGAPHTGAFSCPSCWVRNTKVVELFSTPSTTDADLFVCKVCGFEISIDE